MVGFFGFGSPAFGVSLGFGYGNVGWVPLAPFERYRPWYGRGFGGGRNVTVVNNANIASVYRNARFSGAVTGLRTADFGRAGVSRSAMLRPNSTDLARAGVVSGGMPFAPARNNAAVRSLGAAGAARFNNSRPSERSGNVVRLDGLANNGGWRRLESQPGAAVAGGNRPDVRTFSSPRSAPQPVRISPQIVNNRFESRPNATEPGGFGNFGGARSAGFGAPPAQRAAPAYSAPRANPGYSRPPQGAGGGGYRGAPPSSGSAPRGGGAAHGGGGGSGGSHNGGHGR